ncbi:hypothetical protein B0H21DRAFT_841123 [Amylocystis lapponica]|nr:hypothetical protein B0H21DRAFT_841123 [Amylocystis lapponica]
MGHFANRVCHSPQPAREKTPPPSSLPHSQLQHRYQAKMYAPFSSNPPSDGTFGNAPSSDPAQGMLPKPAKPRASELLMRLENHESRLHDLETRNAGLTINLEAADLEVMNHRQMLKEMDSKMNAVLTRINELEAQSHERAESTTSANSDTDSADSDPEIKDHKRDLAVIKAAAAAVKDINFKELVRQVYQIRMGVPNLKSSIVPMWPKDGEEAPLDAGTGKQVLRFRWEQKWDAPDNFAGIQILTRFIKQQGGDLVPGAAKAVRMLGEADIQHEVVKKFNAIQKVLRQANRLSDGRGRSTIPPENTLAGGDGSGTADGKESKVDSKSALTSRAKGKLVVCLRKYKDLPPDSKFRDPKYIVAFSENAMSDDETVLEPDGSFPGRYTSRAPAYRSAELIELFDTVDAVKDPNPSGKYIPRVKAQEPVDVPPKVAKFLKNRVRRWMVDPEWLAKPENKGFDVETRIADSGIAWGDAEDPEHQENLNFPCFPDEEKETRLKRFRDEKTAVTQSKRARKAQVSDPAKEDRKGKGKEKRSKKKRSKRNAVAGPSSGAGQERDNGDKGGNGSDGAASSSGLDYTD